VFHIALARGGRSTQPVARTWIVAKRLPPIGAIKIPAHSLFYAYFEGLLSAPAELGLQFCSIYCVTLIKTVLIGDVGYQTLIGLFAWSQLVKVRTDLSDDINVASLIPPADICKSLPEIMFPGSIPEHAHHRHGAPISDVQTIAIDC
jgi:hypothetical protein